MAIQLGQQPLQDRRHQGWPAIDPTCVQLDQAGTRRNPLPSRLGRINATHSDQGQGWARRRPQPPHHLQGPVAQGRPTQAARFLRQGATGLGQAAPLQAKAIQARIHCNHACQALLVGEAGNAINGLVLQVGGDLDQQGRAGRQPPQPFHQPAQRGLPLQLPQPRRVRRTDVDHGVIGQGRQ